MKVSEHGADFIAKWEGEILKVYADPIGLPTLGIGHLLTKSEIATMPVGTKITKELSRHYFAKDIAKFERAVTDAVAVSVNQNQFDALVSLAFNIGIGGFNKSSVVRNLNANKPVQAANSFLAWNKAGGKVLKGLTNRREAERKLFLSPTSAAPSTQPSEKVIEPEIEHGKSESAIAADISETKTTEIVQAANVTTAVETTQPKGDAPDVPPTQVTKNGPISAWLFTGGGLTMLGTAIWGFVQSNLSAVAVGIICLTLLIVVIIFRKALTDAIRMQTAADPDKKNVT